MMRSSNSSPSMSGSLRSMKAQSNDSECPPLNHAAASEPEEQAIAEDRGKARLQDLPARVLHVVRHPVERDGPLLRVEDRVARARVPVARLAELEARVRALTRRSSGTTPTIQCGALTYDQVGRVAQIQGQTLDLSAREIGLLEVLLNRMGRLVSKDQLVDHLCGWGEEVSHNAIEVYVHRLRKKLEAGGVKIATVRGLGYCLERPQAE